MGVKINRMFATAAAVASLLSLAACGGSEADEAAPVETASETTDTAASAQPAASADGASAAEAANAGPGEFKETVRAARCKIYDPGGDYEGPCQFTEWEGGSFMVSRSDNAEFFAGITEVVVEVDAPGIAGGSIRQQGESNFLGTMERHSDDGACWSSADFTVCAY